MVIRLSAALLLSVFSLMLHAETLPDPTRPPAALDAGAAAAALPAGPAVQVIRNVHGKRSAVISGQEVVAGSKFGESVVTRIDEDRVELRGPEGAQTLKLFPDVEKHPVAATATKAQYKHRASKRRKPVQGKED